MKLTQAVIARLTAVDTVLDAAARATATTVHDAKREACRKAFELYPFATGPRMPATPESAAATAMAEVADTLCAKLSKAILVQELQRIVADLTDTPNSDPPAAITAAHIEEAIRRQLDTIR